MMGGGRRVAFGQQSVNGFKPPLARSGSLESLSLPGTILILSGTPAFVCALPARLFASRRELLQCP
jgi:hypothetical protein